MCERAKSRNKEEMTKFLFAVYCKDQFVSFFSERIHQQFEHIGSMNGSMIQLQRLGIKLYTQNKSLKVGYYMFNIL